MFPIDPRTPFSFPLSLNCFYSLLTTFSSNKKSDRTDEIEIFGWKGLSSCAVKRRNKKIIVLQGLLIDWVRYNQWSRWCLTTTDTDSRAWCSQALGGEISLLNWWSTVLIVLRYNSRDPVCWLMKCFHCFRCESRDGARDEWLLADCAFEINFMFMMCVNLLDTNTCMCPQLLFWLNICKLMQFLCDG